ncbi:pectinesterase family protein [Arcticibacter eurypsychrophilus]|uniref:pectinesterase family protein n=1 Tax=Arcticibacter eurypsychrophilus TaxID=1434752 RepID=UPI00084DE7BB|nr:pectinesterase family protein [Arcticibacter eurypsychrophilus]
MKRILILIGVILNLASSSAQQRDFVVAQDGSGNFKTVQEAIYAVPDFRKNTTVIFIKNGVYREKLVLAASKTNIKLVGESVEKTIFTYDDYSGKKNRFGENIGTSGSASCYFYGENIRAENITFQNSSGPVGQAVAISVSGDKVYFKNCRFLGFQDTLYTYGYYSRQYYTNCYIEGTVDFIFGSSTAVFNNCEIFCKKNGYVTAASTHDTTKYGYVFINCKITGDAPDGSFYLGRPWRPYAKVVFIKCDLGKVIKPEGWNNWGKVSNEQTTYYAEYKNTGAGYKPTQRASWSHQLTDEAVKEYQIEKIFRGWIPE